MSVYSVAKFIKMLLLERWVRYCIAVTAIVVAASVVASALLTREPARVTGTIATVARVPASASSKMPYAAVTLSGGQVYRVYVADFTPPLAEPELVPGASVELWSIATPLNDPYVVALTIGGTAGGDPRHTTDQYTHPEHKLAENLMLGAVFFAIGLLALAAGRFLPAPESDRKRRERSERARMPERSWGEFVVGRPVGQAGSAKGPWRAW